MSPEFGKHVGQGGVCFREFRIRRDRAAEELRSHPAFRFQFVPDKRPALQEKVISGRIRGAPRALVHPDRGGQLDSKRFHDRSGDLVLQRENVAQVAIEAFRPESDAAGRVGQANRNPRALAGLPHAPFEQGADADCAC
jgi:hypothetical protein